MEEVQRLAAALQASAEALTAKCGEVHRAVEPPADLTEKKARAGRVHAEQEDRQCSTCDAGSEVCEAG